MSFAGKTAVVTGASRGMGAATAALLAERGARVICAQRGGSAHEDIPVDFLAANAGAQLVAELKKYTDRLDILVNNAGIMREADVGETSDQDWADQLHVNLTVPFQLIRGCLPMLKASQGAVVNVGSIEGLGNNPQHAAYGASKAGLHGLTRAVAVDCGPEVRCNAVAPGWIDTELNEEYIASLGDPVEFRAKIGDIHPLGRSGYPEEVARLICWLASDEASFVTGQVWTIDGGRMTQLSLP